MRTFAKLKDELIVRDVYLPTPSYFRVTDLERLLRCLRKRNRLYGYLNPDMNFKQGLSKLEINRRFRELKEEKITHEVFNFRLNDKGIFADILFKSNELLDYVGEITIKRRANNYIWLMDDERSDTAPGLLAFDLLIP